MSSAPPKVSVITVNFNGARFLPGLLESLEAQTYPNFEILVVDNGSVDGSVELVRRSYPRVSLIEAHRNLGFAAGNNLAIQRSDGAYVALINNDVVVEPRWLEKLVEAAEESPQIGAVGSKILYARPFVPVRFRIPTFSPSRQGLSTDTRELGVFVGADSGFADCEYDKQIHVSGFFGPETIHETAGRWCGGDALVWMPVESTEAPGRLRLRVLGGAGTEVRTMEVTVGNSEPFRCEVESGWQEPAFDVPASTLQEESSEIINNAGSFLEPDGFAGDRGINKPDEGQFDRLEDVTALCGCSMLIPRQALTRVGLLDTDFFMYFEDTDLSWRLSKAGYRLRYQPESVVRHFHASTSVEWSPKFQFFVARNRVLMLIRHARLVHAVRAYLAEVYRFVGLLRTHRSLHQVDVRTRLRVHLSLLKWGPLALLNRLGLRRP